uniref:(northern house mosquito) hypothetical protein n=1 Tax=Culex pipiens TaxID=7175 RepID=A0A8D8D854_CULPI
MHKQRKPRTKLVLLSLSLRFFSFWGYNLRKTTKITAKQRFRNAEEKQTRGQGPVLLLHDGVQGAGRSGRLSLQWPGRGHGKSRSPLGEAGSARARTVQSKSEAEQSQSERCGRLRRTVHGPGKAVQSGAGGSGQEAPAGGADPEADR